MDRRDFLNISALGLAGLAMPGGAAPFSRGVRKAQCDLPLRAFTQDGTRRDA